jgi:hypothetical protein
VTFPDEVIMAYADDELDAPTRAAVEAAMASNPEIARRIAQQQALRSRVHSAFNKVLDEPVPARLLQVVRSERAGARRSNVVPLRQRWGWPQWTAMAASLIIGVIAGRLALVRFGAGPLVVRGGQILASGALADALSDQLAASQSAAARVRIGVSFRSKAGQYCRTFTVRESTALAGLACRAADGWRVGVLAGAPLPGGAGTYRQAASAMPPVVITAIGEQIVGEPLDAPAEAAARRKHWQP